ncbi:hypothetical protein EI16_09670 [Hydrogenovibrio marinus]|uniref:Uncharacterized protein n=2 Tax=Hydrogenovibrio marinus TaxID=28885 RepID=A0A066ZRS7_HYDMR|nr:hypothetical protein [Hydrogenovibrio marinus]KDN96518.1 hypothetical protein EI16_09670 [Hydrogenovibrio marinus]BBN60278.1 hypothetical protein HVMH_1872 [Hydrogenovibrio marinus]
MKKLFLVFLAVSALQLTGCSTMMTKENNNKIVSGYYVKLDNDKRITDKVINLSFEVSKEANLRGFELSKLESDVRDDLISKGITLSPTGRKVTVRLNSLKLWKNNFRKSNSYSNGISDGVGDALGLGLAARVVGGLVENKVNKSMQSTKPELNCTEDCSPEMNFSIIADNYETNVHLRAVGKVSYYYSYIRNFTERAVVEFFEPK